MGNAKKPKHQEAHLRVVLHNEGRYQLLSFADVRGFNFYAGPHGVQNMLRSSWHETGKVHMHTPVGRKIAPPRIMPEQFQGKVKLFSGGYTGPDWSYAPKPDSSTRRTLIIDKRLVERGLACDIWAVEAGRDDLVVAVLAEYSGSSGIELVSHVRVDWTRPQLMAVAGTSTLASWESFQRSRGGSVPDAHA